MNRLIIFILSIIAIDASAQINIWEGTDCNKKVKLTPYLVENHENSKAIIVCPGGSYFWHDSDTEGHEVAKWLQSNGIAAFVLDYRAAQVPAFIFHHRYLFRGNRYPDPQDDLRQALRLIRSISDKYGINPDSIGVMGFSAGGHLVMSAAELFDRADWPAFIVPVYPVVTMTEDCVHKRSRRGLLGDNNQHNKELCDSLSLERHVPEGCPPVFLVNCVDDPVVDYRNSVLLDSALTAKGVNHRYLQFQSGGHGFGASDTKGTEECRQWRSLFLQWLSELGDKNQSINTQAQP
ncbi:MAG: alpha/beta hydrolase [Bacteroidales bacterium]|nr:alpha/beta hydrolase [Bacteroidales bacterium]MCD8394938.1 alpha/beta hydrolase [Bacteroidales bacterium]